MPLPRPCKIALFVALSVLFTKPLLAAEGPVKSDSELLALASVHTESDLRHLPLGDGHYVLDGPRVGYIYMCMVPRGEEGGAGSDGPWIHGSTWNPEEKISVSGDQAWSNASFTMSEGQNARTFTGNGLPISHATGFFPVQPNDPAFHYDRNPNHIEPRSFSENYSLTPVYEDLPHCMGMEVGVMLTGVPLFNGFDANMRDAAAHEIQDKCNGHPQKNGQYHYHSLSKCISNTDVHTVIGYALDGFPITGGQVAPGKVLMTKDLDVCHGITSEIIIDGKKTMSYHYVMTPDFPYSASCFHAPPSRMGPANAPRGKQNSGAQGGPQMGGHPPPEAVAVCASHPVSSACGFISPRGDQIVGQCMVVRDGSMACVPAWRR